jgi:hypothetical protein
MSQTKHASKGKRSKKALSVSVLSVAGMSLAATTGGSEAGMLSPGTAPAQAFLAELAEEEISDVSLATFHLYDNEIVGAKRSLLQLTACGRCGCRGCRGCRGCGGCRRCGGGCGGCGWGGCCLSWGGCRPWC